MAKEKLSGKRTSSPFHLEFKNQAQKMAWGAFDQHDVLFLLGPAGTGKTHLACAFAISEILAKKKKRIILTRPIVEAGESLGYLPGTFDEKVNPYMLPMYDCINKCVGLEGPQRDIINRAIEVAPIAYMRGRTFDDAVCIFDESQNATKSQLKLFMTRFGENSKIIITGDPTQSDIGQGHTALVDIVKKLEDVPGIGVLQFKASSIVRHPLIASIIEKFEQE
jgi:phosphate starvation-inducible PhoH-like protein